MNIWNNVGSLLIGTLGTNISETRIQIHFFFFQETEFEDVVCKMAVFCLGLTQWHNEQKDPAVKMRKGAVGMGKLYTYRA